MKKIEIDNRAEFIKLLESVPFSAIISMKVESYQGSWLEGISWDHLMYVYNEEKAIIESDSWNIYTVVQKDCNWKEQLVADFDDIQVQGTAGKWSNVSVCYDEEG